MSLFNKSTSDDKGTEDKWKAKYLNLLDEQDDIIKASQEEQDLLCKTIIRLSLAVKGLDTQLDPHLQHIRNQLKSGLKTEQLRVALSDFSNALLQFEDAQKQPHLESAGLLFEFLGQQYPVQKEQLNAIQLRCSKNEFSQSRELFQALLDVVSQSDAQSTDIKISPDIFSNKLIDTEFFIFELTQLLDSIEVPVEFEAQAWVLKNKLLIKPESDALKAIFDDVLKLLQDIKKFQQSEQQEMALFLSSLTEQLSELSIKATGASAATQMAAKQRNLLDESVSAHMSALQKSSADATTLDVLKQIVTTRIISITSEIQEHAKNDDLQRQETEKQLNELTQKISQLDAESQELKTKLIVAHNKATRDALTNLPNRLAYEETLSNEIARWRRYKTTFSMLIWDIDFFKKINDTYGHKSGDKTLVIIANLLSKHCREADFVARLGGEEFVMLLPNTSEQSALILADKIREVIATTRFNSNGQIINITVSCGISQFRDSDTSETLFERADQALYEAKANGRNRCVIAHD